MEVARRLPVPTGMMPMRTPDPAAPAATAHGPSPSAAMTMDAPSRGMRPARSAGVSRVVSPVHVVDASSLGLAVSEVRRKPGSSCFGVHDDPQTRPAALGSSAVPGWKVPAVTDDVW